MDDLRSDLLKAWQLRRRQLDELLEPLLVEGPFAAAAIALHLPEVVAAADDERAAFEAFLAAHDLGAHDPADRAVAEADPLEDDELSEARQRISRAADLSRRQGHPSQVGPPSNDPTSNDPTTTGPTTTGPTAPDPTATIHRLTPRGRGRKKP